MKRTADARALAASCLAEIASGKSLRDSLSNRAGQLDDARDRALLAALVHQGTRWWQRYQPAVRELFDKPTHEPLLEALIVTGLVQLEVLGLAEYAAVAATVDAARALGKPRFAALVNAVLRRWLRERVSRIAALDGEVSTRTAHPQWLIEMLAQDWPDDGDAILAANNQEAPLWLRVNRRRTTRAEFVARLKSADVAHRESDLLPDAVILAESVDVTRLPGYQEGWFSVQDGAAQFAARLLDLKQGQRVLDACAAPGGKSAHILESADVELLALDRNPARLPRLRENLTRLGHTAEVVAGDAADPAQWWDGRQFDRILLDAPCSATGVIRRQPDIKLHRRMTDIATTAGVQARLLDASWPLLKPGGRLVYATCSVLTAENAARIDRFLHDHADARAIAVDIDWHRAGRGVQNLPGESGMDGFFYALVEKYN